MEKPWDAQSRLTSEKKEEQKRQTETTQRERERERDGEGRGGSVSVCGVRRDVVGLAPTDRQRFVLSR